MKTLIRLQDLPWPEQAISWPQSRTLEDYLYLIITPWNFKALSEEPKLPEILSLLSLAWQANTPRIIENPEDFLSEVIQENKPIVVDVGMGDGNALTRMKKEQGFITVGISLHEIKPENANFIDLVCYSPVPNGKKALKLFHSLRGKVALLCETFGPSTYAKEESNPIEALIYEGLLLAPGGTAKIIVSSIPKEEEQQSPLGFASHRDRLIQFFKKELGLKLVISRSYVKSLVVPGTYCIDYHLEIKRETDACVTNKSLPELFELAKQHIGVCTLLSKVTPIGEFNQFSICGRTYTRADEKMQLASNNIVEDIISTSFKFVGEKNNNPAFTFTFKSVEGMRDFTVRFSEFYLNNHQPQEWSLDQKGYSIEVLYHGLSTNKLQAKEQAKIELNRIFPKLIVDTHLSSLFLPQSPDVNQRSSALNAEERGSLRRFENNVL